MASPPPTAAVPLKRAPEEVDVGSREDVDAAANDSGAGPSVQKKPRMDKRGRNGDRRERSPSAEDGDKEARLPKRACAVLFGYCGVGYSGLQINPGVKTIEGDIFDVMCNAGCVSKDNAVNPSKVGLQRAARTDRGVHAAGNLLNLKLILNPPASPSGDVPTLIKVLNDQLPPLIRIWSINRVQSSFNARSSCDSRYYQYLLPTYVFLPPKPGTSMWARYNSWLEQEQDEKIKGRLEELTDHPFWRALAAEDAAEAAKAEEEEQKIADGSGGDAQPGPDDQKAEGKSSGNQSQFKRDTVRKRQWRLSTDTSSYAQSVLPRIRSLWSRYLGTNNFHNFTVGKAWREPSSKRVMKRMEISDPFIVGKTEYVSMTLHGQSFMLHQIRKMVGFLVLAARSPVPESIVSEAFKPSKIHVPKAPALGLLLNSPVFEAYNKKVRQQNDQIEKIRDKKISAAKLKATKAAEAAAAIAEGDEGKSEADAAAKEAAEAASTTPVSAEEDASLQLREEITFAPFQQEMEAFRMKHIYQTQYETEEREDEFAKWLNYLDAIVGPDFDYLSPKGTVPPESIIGGTSAGKSGQPAAKKDEGAGNAGSGAAAESVSGPAASGLSHEDVKAEEYHDSDDEDDIVGKKAEELEG